MTTRYSAKILAIKGDGLHHFARGLKTEILGNRLNPCLIERIYHEVHNYIYMWRAVGKLYYRKLDDEDIELMTEIMCFRILTGSKL